MTSWIDRVFDPDRRAIDEVILMTLSMDIPCRRVAPTFQRLWAESHENVPEIEMVENVVARLIALTRAGPTTIVTLDGQRSEWPTLKLASMRCGVDLGELANVVPGDGRDTGNSRIEIVDLASWLGGSAANHAYKPVGSHLDAMIKRSSELYRLFLRFLVVNGAISSLLYRKIEKNILRDRDYFNRYLIKNSYIPFKGDKY
jgi:hypothetical protein